MVGGTTTIWNLRASRYMKGEAICQRMKASEWCMVSLTWEKPEDGRFPDVFGELLRGGQGTRPDWLYS